MIKRKHNAYIKKLHKKCAIILILPLMLLSGCAAKTENIKGLVVSKDAYKVLDEEAIGADNLDRSSIMASNSMGFELIKEMAKEESSENLLLSPISLSFALAMLENGAESETKSGILKVLGEDESGLNERYNKLLNYINALDTNENSEIPGIKMKVANSLWIRKELEPKQSFINISKAFYNAEVYRVDFDKEKTLENMNLWVENQTNHLLKETIKQIKPETIAYLMNTVYFKGTWRNEFDESQTNEALFYKSEAEQIKVPMMHMTDGFAYYEDEQCQMTSLPYYGDSSMVLILPKGNLDTYLSALNSDDFQTLMDQKETWSQRLKLSLPKFDYSVNNNLKDFLVKNGMDKAFSNVDAQFNKMVEIKGKNVYVSSIFQNARIILDEKGTEAAAVTVVEMEATSAMPSDPVIFECNKPFIYIIKEDQTGTALFIGIVREP